MCSQLPGRHQQVADRLQSGQIYRFAREIRTGDLVLTPDSPRREILIGRVAGDYSWAPGLVSDEDESYPHLRRVEWLRTVSRDDMVESLRAATGSATTVSSLEGYEEEVVRLLEGRPPDEGTQDQVPFDQETQAKADELISDMLAGLIR